MIKVPSNIGKGRPCRQSSVNEHEQTDPAAASDAANGSKTGHAAFTTQKEAAPWWQIDLGSSYALDSVVVYNWDIVGLPYSAAGRSRARFLQIWGSDDGQAWRLLHDRHASPAGVSDFGGIHHGPLWVPLEQAACRHIKLTLAGGGILQLDEVEIYAVQERETDQAILELLQCAADLNFTMAKRMLAALDLPLVELPAHIKRLAVRLNSFSAVFIAYLLVQNHHGVAAQALLANVGAAAHAVEPGAAGAPPGDTAFLSIHLPPHPLPDDHVLLRIPPVVPPAALPWAPGGKQRLLAIDVDGHSVAYGLEGETAQLLRQDCFIGDDTVLHGLLAAIFARHPALEHIVAADIVEQAATRGHAAKTVTGRGYVLDLPSDFKEYRLTYIMPDLLADIESKEQQLLSAMPQLQLCITAAASMDAAAYRQALHGMAGLSGKDWDGLRPYASLAQLQNGTSPLASALYLEFASDCHVLAYQLHDNALGLDRADLLNILQFRLIAALIARGYRHLHIDCRASADNILFGAIDRPRYTLRFERGGDKHMQGRVLTAIACGEKPARIEADLGVSLETVLGARFEQALQLDFNAIVENDALGTDTNARRYQPTMRDAFFQMMKHVPFNADEVFVDVGSGKGKMLYYAYHLGYQKCVGMEISPILLAQAKTNFERLELPVDIRLWQRDARNLDLAELAEFSLFYLANPFGEEIMRDFLHCLVESQKKMRRTLRIVYCVAMVEPPFARYGFHPVKVFEQGVDGWRFSRSLIYERHPD